MPGDWSDLYVEVDLDSSDFLDEAALLLGPVNPAKVKKRSAFHFRTACLAGYGASEGMTRRSLEHLDGAGMTGSLRILHAYSGSHTTFTQGPVWYVAGRAV